MEFEGHVTKTEFTAVPSRGVDSKFRACACISPGLFSLTEVDLSSLYDLCSHFRPRDVTPEKCFLLKCLMHVHMYEINTRTIPLRASRGLKWENIT